MPGPDTLCALGDTHDEMPHLNCKEACSGSGLSNRTNRLCLLSLGFLVPFFRVAMRSAGGKPGYLGQPLPRGP